jgi:hypothetical protein
MRPSSEGAPESGNGTPLDSSAAPSGLGRFLMHFLGFRFAPPQAIIRARLRRLRASALGHDQKQVSGLGARPKICLSSRRSGLLAHCTRNSRYPVAGVADGI